MRKAPRNTPLGTALTPYSIGLKLKTLRTEKGLTLTRIGAEVGLSSGLLSKLESEHMIPTIPPLLRIFHVHGVDLTYFFAAPRQHSLAITRHSHMMDGPESSQVSGKLICMPPLLKASTLQAY